MALPRYLADRTNNNPNPRYDRDGLVAWFNERFGTELDTDEIRNKLRPEIELYLIEKAHQNYVGARKADELRVLIHSAYGDEPEADRPAPEPEPKALAELVRWARQEIGVETSTEEMAALDRIEARNKLVEALDAKYRGEMREMEKVLVLQFLDGSWMEHLRGMDHLRSSVGLRGYAQVDPKVEYKREGMKLFEEMWTGVSDKVTDLIFRMEQFDPEFLQYIGARWQPDRQRTIHEAAPSEPAVDGSPAQREAVAAGQARNSGGGAEVKHEPVRNTGPKVGRNDPCPCGSGKKFKACHMRKGGGDF